VGASVIALFAAPLSVMVLADGSAGAMVEKGKDFLALMKDRSPGERTTAELTKSKNLRVAAVIPRQRALAKVQKAAPAEAPAEEFLEALAPPLTQTAELPGIFVPMDLVQPLSTIPPEGGGPVITIPGGPGGPGVFPPGGNTTPTVVPPPAAPPEVPAVPEPSTWLSMLLGFGLLGSAFRLRRQVIARA
jgi:hypothetical protein